MTSKIFNKIFKQPTPKTPLDGTYDDNLEKIKIAAGGAKSKSTRIIGKESTINEIIDGKETPKIDLYLKIGRPSGWSRLKGKYDREKRLGAKGFTKLVWNRLPKIDGQDHTSANATTKKLYEAIGRNQAISADLASETLSSVETLVAERAKSASDLANSAAQNPARPGTLLAFSDILALKDEQSENISEFVTKLVPVEESIVESFEEFSDVDSNSIVINRNSIVFSRVDEELERPVDDSLSAPLSPLVSPRWQSVMSPRAVIVDSNLSKSKKLAIGSAAAFKERAARLDELANRRRAQTLVFGKVDPVERKLTNIAAALSRGEMSWDQCESALASTLASKWNNERDTQAPFLGFKDFVEAALPRFRDKGKTEHELRAFLDDTFGLAGNFSQNVGERPASSANTDATPTHNGQALPGLTLFKGDASERFEPIRLLGKGGYGAAYEYSAGDKKVAVKILLQDSPEAREAMRLEAYMQAQAAAEVGGEKPTEIIEFLGLVHIEGIGLGLITELASGGDLTAAWAALETGADENLLPEGMKQLVARAWTQQMLTAVAGLHQRGLAHRDIKIENFFLSSDGGLKMADFGTATEVGAQTVSSWKGIDTPQNKHPEVFIGAKAIEQSKAGTQLKKLIAWLGSKTPVTRVDRAKWSDLYAFLKPAEDEAGWVKEKIEAAQRLKDNEPNSRLLTDEESNKISTARQSEMAEIDQREKVEAWKSDLVGLGTAFAFSLGIKSFFQKDLLPFQKEERLIAFWESGLNAVAPQGLTMDPKGKFPANESYLFESSGDTQVDDFLNVLYAKHPPSAAELVLHPAVRMSDEDKASARELTQKLASAGTAARAFSSKQQTFSEFTSLEQKQTARLQRNKTTLEAAIADVPNDEESMDQLRETTESLSRWASNKLKYTQELDKLRQDFRDAYLGHDHDFSVLI